MQGNREKKEQGTARKGKAIQKSKGREEGSCELSGCGGKDVRGVATSALKSNRTKMLQAQE